MFCYHHPIKVADIVVGKCNVWLAIWIEGIDHAEKPLKNNKKKLERVTLTYNKK